VFVESILLAVTRINTFSGSTNLTGASGFFFRREQQLFLVTSRHVLIDELSGHHPDRVEIELHIDSANLGASLWYSIPLYVNGQSVWREGYDAGGAIDVAVLPLHRSALPETLCLHAFTERNLPQFGDTIEIGSSVLIIGAPLGFHDSLHHLPVVRQAGIASSFGLRFQGNGYFLTDARTHRGSSGAPVVMRAHGHAAARLDSLPWLLLGVHSMRLDMEPRDMSLDEALGLNCAWYTDIVLTLTAH